MSAQDAVVRSFVSPGEPSLMKQQAETERAILSPAPAQPFPQQ
jgi:hypothetical protein